MDLLIAEDFILKIDTSHELEHKYLHNTSKVFPLNKKDNLCLVT